MRTLKPLVGTLVVLASSCVMAQQASVPVIDRSDGKETAAPRSAPAPQQRAAMPPNQVAELLMTLDQLQEEVRFLRGRVEEQGHQMDKMRKNQRDRYRDLDRRITLLTQRLAEEPPKQSALPPVVPPALAGTEGAGTTPTAVPQLTDSQAYRQAFAKVRQREYTQALAAFAAFERDYPQSLLLANALYWTGEVHRAKPNPDQEAARQAYQRLLERFPQHAKAPEATYKLALTEAALGNRQQAAELMQQVVRQYPDQQSAQLARDFLSQN
ncbi:tol-pal system protein YbgF [Motiliproteus sp. SC1-56]|uniref:tol-pal system protein YbgF n=1 Tax=Motiliproteus sp. SC1-56 TaxID=2799565 RepID=UPI001A8F46B5|nr:tol-pal system protein YbgF [Motiliproteus sp. SC1-56]